jgi:hypothetical protein
MMFTTFYNISQPNFAILITHFSMFFLAVGGDLFASPCLVLKLVYIMGIVYYEPHDFIRGTMQDRTISFTK